MIFNIVVHSAPCASQAAASALSFAQAALLQDHEIYRIFFFGDGVYNATRGVVTAADEVNLPLRWQQFIRDNEIDAVVCSSSALRRGLLDAAESQRNELELVSLLDGFEIAGLGQFVDAALQSDRTVNFG